MTKSQRVTPKGDYIGRLIAEKGYQPEAFANEDPTIDIKLIRAALKGAPSTPKTIQTIVAKLRTKGVEVIFDDLIESTVPSVAATVPSVAGTRNQDSAVALVTIDVKATIAVHPSVIPHIELDKLTESLQMTVSETAKLLVKRLTESYSIDMHLVVNASARDDLIQSFLYGRLQFIGTYALEFIAPVGYHQYVIDTYYLRYYFIDDDMSYRFQSLIASGEETTVASPNGILTFRHYPLASTEASDVPSHHWKLHSTLSPSNIQHADSSWTLSSGYNFGSFEARYFPAHVSYSNELRLPPLPAILIDEHFLNAPRPEPVQV